jgi:hypothetical protein
MKQPAPRVKTDGRRGCTSEGSVELQVADSGIDQGRVSPAIIPDYTDPAVRERQLTANYVGNVR